MIRILTAAALLAATAGVAGLAGPTPGTAAAPLSAAAHELSVEGAGVGIYPEFDPATERYAITTTADTGGDVTVTASTSDPGGTVRVDGVPVEGGTTELTGLASGDEISVIFQDSGGTEVHSLIYLPAGFPALEASTPASADVAPGQIGLTLSDFVADDPRFVTTVDRNGVPSHVQTAEDAEDLKRQPDGSITVSEPTAADGRTGSDIVEYDDQWHEVARHRTVGLVNTDLHDSIFLPDGTRWLVAYEPDADTGLWDAVIQETKPDGTVGFQWDSGDFPELVDESVAPRREGDLPPVDYAHINSIELTPDGDIIASFRHLSAVLRIATSAHDGYQSGAIEWKLGGRASSFSFVDDPDDGPCAQHTATLLPNGHILVFDDGSGLLAGPLCVDQEDPAGPTHDRTQSRVAEYALDEVEHTATLVWDYQPPGWYSWFMGSAKRLDNGNTLIGWAAETDAIASEVAPDGDLDWELRLASSNPPPYLSYRASLMDVPDVTDPVVTVTVPSGRPHYAVGQSVPADFSCTDTGGSSLAACGDDVQPGDLLDTSTPGSHTVDLAGVDGAGNATTVSRSYVVDAPASYAVDATLRGGGTSRTFLIKRDGRAASVVVRITNRGNRSDRFRVLGGGQTLMFGVSYESGGRTVTRPVITGSFRTPSLAPGATTTVKIVMVRKVPASPGDRHALTLRATSEEDPRRHDGVTMVVRATR